MASEPTLYVLDEIELRPGARAEFLAAFEAEYRPAAERRGMRLEHIWVTPPLEVDVSSETVVLVWALSGVPGFWAMRGQAAADDAAGWWFRCEPFIERRSRRYAAEARDLPVLDDAGRRNA